MKLIFILLIFYSIVYITTSCEKIKPPFKETLVPEDSDSDTEAYVQKVLIEDFTGAKCGNCPKAHEKTEELKALYEGKIISISIHSGFFATPNMPPYTSYTYDFRTQTGDEIVAFFNNGNSYPSGLINRKKINNSYSQSWQTWGSIIDSLVKVVPRIELEIENFYDTTSRILQTNIKTDILLNLNAPLKLCVYLTEDSIIAWQTYYGHNPVDVSNYLHRHVLRGAINGTFGDLISTGAVQQAKSFHNTYAYTLKSEWKDKHCSVVAFIYDDDTKEIIQVEEQDKFYILLK